MFGCCLENRALITAPCGRAYTVCVVCDNGINNCTEGYCTHERLEEE